MVRQRMLGGQIKCWLAVCLFVRLSVYRLYG